jgi:hypothetical protein
LGHRQPEQPHRHRPRSYESKVAINEAWTENYGAGGALNGPDIAFNVPDNAISVTFSFNSAPNMPSVTIYTAGHDHDNNVEYFGLGHNSYDTLYRVPFGSVTPGTEVTLRFRTYHHDVTNVTTRFYNTTVAAESFQEMELVAEDVSCYDEAQPDESCLSSRPINAVSASSWMVSSTTSPRIVPTSTATATLAHLAPAKVSIHPTATGSSSPTWPLEATSA